MTIDLPGFADPVRDAQATFRAVLGAMSRPGTRHAGGLHKAPAPLHPATAAVLLALVDAESPLWLDPQFQPAAEWLVFHTGCTLATRADQAAFVLSAALPDLATLATGTDDAPEASATVILQISGFAGDTGLVLDGPGLAAPAALRADGLAADFAACWAANHALFPRGVDLILCAGAELAALPRSTRVREG